MSYTPDIWREVRARAATFDRVLPILDQLDLDIGAIATIQRQGFASVEDLHRWLPARRYLTRTQAEAVAAAIRRARPDLA